MPFPEVDRIIYGQNQLDRVICQVRFPPILRIDATVPSEFQEAIRSDFTEFVEKTEFQFQISQEASSQAPSNGIQPYMQSTGKKNFEFSSADNNWKINLTRTFLTLTSTAYNHWAPFLEKFEHPLEAMREEYGPSHYTRVGLRYINVIRRSQIDLQDVPWSELLSPSLLGLLGPDLTDEMVENINLTQEIKLQEEVGIARIITKLVKSTENDEELFLLDGDFFDRSQLELSQASVKLTFFNDFATRFFEWAITDRLREALEPQNQ